MAENLAEASVPFANRGDGADRIPRSMDKRNVLIQIPMRKSRKLRVSVDRSL